MCLFTGGLLIDCILPSFHASPMVFLPLLFSPIIYVLFSLLLWLINTLNPILTSTLYVLALFSPIKNLLYYSPVLLFDYSTSYLPQNQSTSSPPSWTWHLGSLHPDEATDKSSRNVNSQTTTLRKHPKEPDNSTCWSLDTNKLNEMSYAELNDRIVMTQEQPACNRYHSRLLAWQSSRKLRTQSHNRLLSGQDSNSAPPQF